MNELCVSFRLQQRSDDQGHDAHELDEDVERGTGGVLERIAHCVALNGSGVSL
jgi:hypothetical protein